MANLLIVDDDIDYLTQQKIRLQDAGYDVMTASSVEEAETILRESPPDLMISDLMMEQLDSGFTLCHRASNLLPDLPMIILTAVTRETGMVFDAGTPGKTAWIKADAIFAKPVRPEQLFHEIERLLHRDPSREVQEPRDA